MLTVDQLQAALDKVHRISGQTYQGASDRRRALGEVQKICKDIIDAKSNNMLHKGENKVVNPVIIDDGRDQHGWPDPRW